MERKIGEIFEYEDNWYQCVESDSCGECSLFTTECGSGTKSDLADKVFGQCSKVRRTDNKHVIFKKLEKVGEPYDFQKRTFQTYKLHTIPFLSEDVELVAIPSKDNNTIEIEIKQNKEDMEEKNITFKDLVSNYLNGKITFAEFKNEAKKLYNKEDVNLKLKPFNLEAAKAGKPVCTRDGRKARIICFDKRGEQPIVALIEKNEEESIDTFFNNGHSVSKTNEVTGDLMMLPEKKEGWVNIYALNPCYSSKEEAEANIDRDYEHEYVRTVKIEWEE